MKTPSFDTPEALVFGFLVAALLLFLKQVSEQQTAYIKRKRDSYTKLLTLLNRQIHNPHPENLLALNEARAETFLLSSDKVAKAIGHFFNVQQLEHSMRETDIPVKRVLLEAYAEMALVMRRDCFSKSKLKSDEAIEILPITYSIEGKIISRGGEL